MSDLEVLDGRGRPRAVVVDGVEADESALLDIRDERCVVKAIVDDEGALFDVDVDWPVFVFGRALPYNASYVDLDVISGLGA